MFEISYRVYYEDTDASGVMYHGRYLAFMERARSDYLRHLGFSQARLLKECRLGFVVAEADIRFVRPARLDDELRLGLEIQKLGRASVSFLQEVHLGSQVCASARVRVGSITLDNFRPCAMTPTVYLALQQDWVAHVV